MGNEIGKQTRGRQKRTPASHYCCRFRALPTELHENEESRNYHSLYVAHAQLSRIGTLPRDLPLRFCIHRVGVAVSVWLLPAPSPPRFPLVAAAALCVLCCEAFQLFSASPLCHLFIKRSAASTTPRCQFLLFLAALRHSSLYSEQQ